MLVSTHFDDWGELQDVSQRLDRDRFDFLDHVDWVAQIIYYRQDLGSMLEYLHSGR